MQKANRIFLFSIISLIFVSSSFTNINSITNNNIQSELIENDCVECVGVYPEGDYVELTTFPIDLDLLFWEDDPLVQATKLNTIGNNSWGWVLTPWGGHFISSHFEGADKWYFYADRPLDIVAPLNGKLRHYSINNGTSDIINGTNVIVDVKLVINIGGNCAVKFEHFTILESLHNELLDGKYTFTEGEHLGFPTNWGDDLWTIDFHYWYKSHDICPYPGLSPTIQGKIRTLFDLQYQRAKQAGFYPQSKLCNDMCITIEGSLWGVWSYQSGPFDSFMSGVDRIFGYTVGGFTMLNREFANPDTFWRNIIDPAENLTTDIIGLY